MVDIVFATDKAKRQFLNIANWVLCNKTSDDHSLGECDEYDKNPPCIDDFRWCGTP